MNICFVTGKVISNIDFRFIIDDKGLWPRVLGLEMPFPEAGYDKYL